MKKVILLILILLFSSCSTLKKSQIYSAVGSALVCGTLGMYLGEELSPDHESIGFNKTIGGSLGTSICGIGGYFLGGVMYQSDPRNIEMEPIKFEKLIKSSNQEVLNTDINGINVSDLKLTQLSTTDIPLIKGLPSELKEKIVKQEVIKYSIKPQTIKTSDGRTIYYSGATAIEHKYKRQ